MHRQTTYVDYARVYDSLKGDRYENIDRLKDLIRIYAPEVENILDLACGTGSVTAGLAKNYHIIGLDASKQMLKIAKKRLPSLQFINADMTNFKIDQKFDVIYCIHNSVNHLLTTDELSKMFSCVYNHLNIGGIFIFDVNTVDRMERLVNYGLGVNEINNGYFISQVSPSPKVINQYLWLMKIFTKKSAKYYKLSEEMVVVQAYPTDILESLIENYFVINNCFTVENAIMQDDIGRAYYVCAKVN